MKLPAPHIIALSVFVLVGCAGNPEAQTVQDATRDLDTKLEQAKKMDAFERKLCDYGQLVKFKAFKEYISCRRTAILKFWDEAGFVGRPIIDVEWSAKVVIADRLDKKQITVDEANLLFAQAAKERAESFHRLAVDEAMSDAAVIQADAAQDIAFAAGRQADAAESMAQTARSNADAPPRKITCTRWADTVTCR